MSAVVLCSLGCFGWLFSAATWRGQASDVPFGFLEIPSGASQVVLWILGGFRVGGSENPGDSHQELFLWKLARLVGNEGSFIPNVKVEGPSFPTKGQPVFCFLLLVKIWFMKPSRTLKGLVFLGVLEQVLNADVGRQWLCVHEHAHVWKQNFSQVMLAVETCVQVCWGLRNSLEFECK